MPHNQTVIDALCQVVSRHLPPPLQSVLDALMDRLQEQRIHAGSNKEEQTYIDFFRVCKHLREAVHLDTAAGICQRLRHSAPLSAAPTDLSEWNLVDDAEVEAMLDTRRLARGLREPLGNLEWRVCNCLGQLDSSLKKDSDNPLSLEFLLHTLQAGLRLHEQPVPIRELFYRCCIEVLGRGLQDYLQHRPHALRQEIDTLLAEQRRTNRLLQGIVWGGVGFLMGLLLMQVLTRVRLW